MGVNGHIFASTWLTANWDWNDWVCLKVEELQHRFFLHFVLSLGLYPLLDVQWAMFTNHSTSAILSLHQPNIYTCKKAVLPSHYAAYDAVFAVLCSLSFTHHKTNSSGTRDGMVIMRNTTIRFEFPLFSQKVRPYHLQEANNALVMNDKYS